MENQRYKPRSRKPLNTHSPKVQMLSEKYNLAPKVVAYIRAAILDGKYNKKTLIEHIEVENAGRRRAIEEHKESTIKTPEEKENLIKWTQINIDFREGVIEVLNRIDDFTLRDILRP